MFWSFDIRVSDLVVLKIHLFGQVTFYFDVSLMPLPKGLRVYGCKRKFTISPGYIRKIPPSASLRLAGGRAKQLGYPDASRSYVQIS